MGAPGQPGEEYRGFEQGPIRPPSEAHSLLLRVTRNCPWNRCAFCPVYKGTRFSLRPVAHVKRDLDAVRDVVELIRGAAGEDGALADARVAEALARGAACDQQALAAAWHWAAGGMRSVFLQDANSLAAGAERLVEILSHVRALFPWVERVTSYARSQTLAKMADGDLRALAVAGLNRIHVGLESGADEVLRLVKKGVTREMHIAAGLKVKSAGIELSEYVMPGLGGRRLSEAHALATADALNRIDPDFIRLRTLAVPAGVELAEEVRSGRFQVCSDVLVAREILLLIQSLEGIHSVVKSDHILNLFEDVEGRLPEDQERMLATIRAFLDMDPRRQVLYQVGRRLGYFTGPSGLDDPAALARVERVCEQLGVGPENVEEMTRELMTRFV
ncbi:MAG: radical SAM protein [Planctomycetes bacterium]|nr:radical SAM protein [Planctomycetota bacterium]